MRNDSSTVVQPHTAGNKKSRYKFFRNYIDMILVSRSGVSDRAFFSRNYSMTENPR